jgi:hypothetical protein
MKTPPVQLARRHVHDPIRIQPFGHIVVASHGHKPARDAAATNSFGDRRRTNFRDCAVNDTGELVEDDDGGLGDRDSGLAIR